jgi:hypothetical protein
MCRLVESVVVALTIPMVDMLIAAQWSANGLLDNLAVFIDGALFAFWGTYTVSHIPLLIFAIHCVSFFVVWNALAASPLLHSPQLARAVGLSRSARHAGLFGVFGICLTPVGAWASSSASPPSTKESIYPIGHKSKGKMPCIDIFFVKLYI